MTAKEIIAAIRFDERDLIGGILRVKGELCVVRTCDVHVRSLQSRETIVADCQKQLTREILRKIYDDQRRAMFQAVGDLLKVTPAACTQEQLDAVSSILALARYQPPEGALAV